MKYLLITFIFCSHMMLSQKVDSIKVKPTPQQAEILEGIQKKGAAIQAELERVNAEYETALLMLLNVRKEEIATLEFKNGVFLGTKKPK